MKVKLKRILGTVGLGIFSLRIFGADTAVPYITYTTNSPTPGNYSPTNTIAVTSSNSIRLALSAQSLLLSELIHEHEKRASELMDKKLNEKAQWETELVNELQGKNAKMQKDIEATTQPGTAPIGSKAGASEVDDQLAFVSTVEAALEQVRQELSAALEQGSALSIQISTNKATEDFPGLSVGLSQNQRVVRQLQKEQLDLELRKLEFHALQKLLQK